MFWHSVVGGLAVLLHWQTWVGMLIYGALVLIPIGLVGAASERDMRAGCIGMLLLPFTQVFASIAVLWILLPITLGIGNDALWGMPFQIALQNPWWMLKISVVLTVIAALAGVIPIIGGTATFTNFLVGSIAISLATKSFALASGRDTLARVNYVPGFWTFIGFLVIGGLASTIAGFTVAALSVFANRGTEEAKPGPLTMSVVGTFGLIPCFMYGAWLGLQIRAMAP
jgi:hypothetical protein